MANDYVVCESGRYALYRCPSPTDAVYVFDKSKKLSSLLICGNEADEFEKAFKMALNVGKTFFASMCVDFFLCGCAVVKDGIRGFIDKNGNFVGD